MSKSSVIFFAILFLLSTVLTNGQSDELRQATGLPFSNDQPVIFGQVTFRGMPSGESKPTVHVALLIGGTQVERVRADSNGYFYFLREPRNGSVLVFELNDLEVGRQGLMAGSGIRLRQDLEINWASYVKNKEAGGRGGVISAEYERSKENQGLFEKGNAALAGKRYADAVEVLKKVVDADPKDYFAWAELGAAYFGEKNYSAADAAYLKCLELKPGNISVLLNRGKLWMAQDKYPEAVEIFSEAIKLQPASADAHHYLGESYLRMKLGSKAVAPLNEAIRLAPKEKADIHLRLAALYNAAGAKNLAANEYRLFLEKVPNYPEKEKLTKYIKENAK